jgi:hypothetical protein
MQSLTAGPKISPSREFPGLEAGRSRRSEGAGINGSSTDRRPAGPVLAAALIGGLLEATGPDPVQMADDCWCKKPVLSTLRWVFS